MGCGCGNKKNTSGKLLPHLSVNKRKKTMAKPKTNNYGKTK